MPQNYCTRKEIPRQAVNSILKIQHAQAIGRVNKFLQSDHTASSGSFSYFYPILITEAAISWVAPPILSLLMTDIRLLERGRKEGTCNTR